MAETTFRSGNPCVIDYTPSGGNVAVGEVVLIGSVTANTAGAGALAAIAHRPITNSTLGALAIDGGIYDVVNLNNAANGARVYWNSDNKVTTVSTNNALFGYIVTGGAGGANSTAQAIHKPFPGWDEA
jgi:hypothetical protein